MGKKKILIRYLDLDGRSDHLVTDKDGLILHFTDNRYPSKDQVYHVVRPRVHKPLRIQTTRHISIGLCGPKYHYESFHRRAKCRMKFGTITHITKVKS